MTQQYIQGELSLRLGELCEAHLPLCNVQALRDVRRRVETAPGVELPHLAAEAMDVVDAACWECLAFGDVVGFVRECCMEASLYEFATCAGLLS